MIYLDNAATSRYKPIGVYKAIKKELSQSANPGHSSHKQAILSLLKVNRTRENVSKYLNCPSEGIIFTSGCTEAVNLAIKGLDPNGTILTTVYEHNAVLRTLESLKKINQIKINVLQPDTNGKITPKTIKKNITSNTKLVIVNHVSNVTGTEQDIYEIGRLTSKYDIPFMVDAAQSFGHKPINLEESKVNFLCAPAHKGINGVTGCGFLATDLKYRLKPIKFGGTGTDSLNLTQGNTIPDDFEAGTINTVGIAALNAAMDWHKDNEEKISKRYKKLNEITFNGFKEFKKYVYLYSKEKNGVYSFNVKGYTSGEITDILSDKFDIMTRAGLHCAPLIHKYLQTHETGAVRISLGVDNTEKELQEFFFALNKIIENRF